MGAKKGCKLTEEHKRKIGIANGGKAKDYASPADVVAFNMLYGNYKSRAINKHELAFELTKEQFRKITRSDCFYCGIIPNQVNIYFKDYSENGKYIYNGVDRMNNNEGYTISNCVPCCGQCNIAKSSFTIEQFKAWIKRAYEYLYDEDD